MGLCGRHAQTFNKREFESAIVVTKLHVLNKFEGDRHGSHKRNRSARLESAISILIGVLMILSSYSDLFLQLPVGSCFVIR
jgi:hypothetical protein